MRMLTSLLVTCSFLAASGTSQAQDTPLVTNLAGRSTVTLNGAWRTIVDPFETGYYDYRYRPRDDGYFLARRPRDKSDLVEYDFVTSPTLQVPGDWNSQDERLFFYEGTVWYRRVFDYNRVNLRSLYDRWHPVARQMICDHLTIFDDKMFCECISQTHNNATFNLTLKTERIEGLTNVIGSDHI